MNPEEIARTAGQIDESSVNRDVALVFNAITRALPRDCFVSLSERSACTSAVLAALDLDARDARVRAETAEGIAQEIEALDERWPVTISHAADIARRYPAGSPVDAPSRPTGTPGPTVVASSVPVATGTCCNCGGPVRYNLAAGFCAHVEPACSCPDCDVSTMADRDAGRWPTVKGLNPSCPIHGESA